MNFKKVKRSTLRRGGDDKGIECFVWSRVNKKIGEKGGDGTTVGERWGGGASGLSFH